MNKGKTDSARRPGEVSIDKAPAPKKRAVDDNAEFVDFEELKDPKDT